MQFPLRYCPDGFARLERLRRLYEARPQDEIFAIVEAPSPTLERFATRYSPGYTDRPDPADRAAFWDSLLTERSTVEDDSIPCAYLSEMDQGLYGGTVGGRIQYMAHPENGWISSMVPPILRDWGEMDGLTVDQSGPAYGYYRDLLDAVRRKAEGRFGISHFILIDGLNFLFELFGATRAYIEVADNPQRVIDAIDFAYRLNVAVQTTFFEAVPLLEGGTCSNMAGMDSGTHRLGERGPLSHDLGEATSRSGGANRHRESCRPSMAACFISTEMGGI